MSRTPAMPRFSSIDRRLGEETTVVLNSVGVDIGSSTSLLVFSRLELELEGQRYIPRRRTIVRESEILLTPYTSASEIDAQRLGAFIDAEYAKAGVRPEEIDTGALILTGTALLRRNARAIGELFAGAAGRFVAVSAGHYLEATLAAHGSGAAAISARDHCTVLNVDVGGGTTKLSLCREGALVQVAALDVGARLVAVDDDLIVTRLEAAGRGIGRKLGLDLEIGRKVERRALERMAAYIAERIAEAAGLDTATAANIPLPWLTPALVLDGPIDTLTFSGGVAEFIHGRQSGDFGDLGPLLARELRSWSDRAARKVRVTPHGIRSTVIGASQHTVQVSGNTIFVSPEDAVPVRDIPVIVPRLSVGRGSIAPESVERAAAAAVARLDLCAYRGPIAVGVAWEGLPGLARLDAFCAGLMRGLRHCLEEGHALVLAANRDMGGLLGIHLKHEMGVVNPVVSIDGIDLRELDFIDVGALIPRSGAVPVVVKSLVFPDVSLERG